MTPASEKAAALEALADRVAGAKGPDRELDAAIWLASVPGATRNELRYVHKASGKDCVIDETRDASRRLIIVPAYSASLDAAMTLVPEGWTWFVRCSLDNEAMAGVYDPAPGFWGDASNALGKTPALALTAAALRSAAALARGEG